MATDTEISAMRRALDAAPQRSGARCPTRASAASCWRPTAARSRTGVHRGAGTPHAEVEALTQAGDAARGATAVVTLEPCNHTGRTGPCAEALIDAGVARVVFAQTDPDRSAAGGAKTLRGRGHRGRARRAGRRSRRPQRRVDVRGDPRPPVRHLEVRRDARRPQRRPRRHQQVDHQRRGPPRRADVPRRGRRDRGGHRRGPRRRPAADGARREGPPAAVRPAAAARRGRRDQDPQLLPGVRPRRRRRC